ncbi:ataxin-10 [Megalops cyprinoides]|uniref:ataxin-10 n=1 Tax=Megalops cyprinoides TaxID=118141 RepID=UPI001863F495|nr:ataxin-10 [Megalops cyprinoides]
MAASSQNTLDIDVKLNEIITSSFTQKHLDILQSLSKALREQEFRTCVERATLQSLLQVLSKLSAQIDGLAKEGSAAESAPVLLQLTAECFRSQRNACVQCARNQTLLRDLGFIEESLQLLAVLSELEPETTACLFEALRCGIQFLGNLAVGNQVCKDDIWKRSFPRLFLDLLEHRDQKTAAYTCMVLYTCLDQHKLKELVLKPEHLEVARKVIRLCRTQPELDWAVFIVTQHFLKSSALVETLFAGLSHQERVTLLELISAQLCEEGGAAGDSGIPPSLAHFLASCFLSRCRTVLSLASEAGPEDEEALTVMRLLDVLCEMTSDHKNFMSLQDHPELLRTAVDLLKEVHSLGKASQNVFSAAQNFSATGPATHPAVSFKAHLVRLIGNLCHAHTANQNQVREMDGIPLILDHCNIDSSNPFISQWAIFAIRILLEHNPQNQEVVQALERRGVADDSALREMGFRLEERDGSLLLKPLSKDP